MKKTLKSFLCLSIAFVFVCLLASGCVKQPDYSNYVNSTYVATNAQVFVDDTGTKSIKSPSSSLKILQLTDIHIGNGPLTSKKDKKAIQAVCKLIESTSPDLIILTGDCVFPVTIMTGTNDNLTALKVLSNVIEKYKTPWTLCFGNHDAEDTAQYSKAELCDYLESNELSYCIFNRGNQNLDGMGNHVINLYNQDETFNSSIFLFDNGQYAGSTQLSGYQEISQSQTNWYETKINEFNAKFEKTIQSFVFYHVPGVEYKNAWAEYKQNGANAKLIYGYANEDNERISCPKEIGTFWNKVLELGSTKAIFCGHDHLNDFSVEYEGVRLTYGKSIDYTAYVFQGISYKTEQRGATVLTLHKNGSFEITPIKLVDIN